MRSISSPAARAAPACCSTVVAPALPVPRLPAGGGVCAALLAQAGFTGAPALTVESGAARDTWGDLGTRWRIREQYFKPHPVCRWAQPAIEAALALRRAHAMAPAGIDRVRIET